MLPTHQASARATPRDLDQATLARIGRVIDQCGRERDQAADLVGTRPDDRLAPPRPRRVEALPAVPTPADDRRAGTSDSAPLGALAHD
jgi:hypothetical protein